MNLKTVSHGNGVKHIVYLLVCTCGIREKNKGPSEYI